MRVDCFLDMHFSLFSLLTPHFPLLTFHCSLLSLSLFSLFISLLTLLTLLTLSLSHSSHFKVGHCALHLSISPEFHSRVAQILLDRNANIESVDKAGDTPLHVAALEGFSEAITFLVTAGAKIDSLNNVIH